MNEVSGGFIARYFGKCASCDGQIEPDDWCRFTEDGVIHVDCDPPAPPRPEKVCQTCWLTSCDCEAQP